MQQKSEKKRISYLERSRMYLLTRLWAAFPDASNDRDCLPIDLALVINCDLQYMAAKGCFSHFTTGPAHPDGCWRVRNTEHLHKAVLGQITAAGMNFPRGSLAKAELKTQLRSDAGGIAGWTMQSNPKSRNGSGVMEQACGSSILGDGQVHAAVVVKIRNSRAALLAVNHKSGFPAGNRGEPGITQAFQKQSTPGVVSRDFRLSGKKVLA